MKRNVAAWLAAGVVVVGGGFVSRDVHAQVEVGRDIASVSVPRIDPVQEVHRSVVARVPAQRTVDFRILASPDFLKVAAIDRWSEGGISKWYIAMNSRVWEFYDAVDAASAQYVSDQLYLLGSREGTWRLVKEDQVLRDLGAGECRGLMVTRNGEHDACIQKVGENNWQVLLDGKPQGPVCDRIVSSLFSDDGLRLGWVGQRGKTFNFVVDGREIGSFEGVQATRLVHAEGKFWSAIATENEILRLSDGLVVERRARTPSAALTALDISPDGKLVAWAERGGFTSIRIRDERVVLPVREVVRMAIGPGGHVAAVGVRPTSDDPESSLEHVMFIDGYPVEDGLTSGELKFLQEGRLRYTTAAGPREYVQALGGWHGRGGVYSDDGRMQVSRGIVNDTYFFEKILLVSSPQTGRGYLLMEEPRPVNVNEKILSNVTRVELRMVTVAPRGR